MKYPAKMLVLQNLQGGQFGTLTVTAKSEKLLEFDFGPDFVRLSPLSARALVTAVNYWLEQLPAREPDAGAAEPPSKEVIVVVDVPG